LARVGSFAECRPQARGIVDGCLQLLGGEQRFLTGGNPELEADLRVE
jgi:hypothetical protein